MTSVETPDRPGWYAFRGICYTRNNQERAYATILRVERGYDGRLMAVTSPSNYRRLAAFAGQWWLIHLPWEVP